MKKAAFIAVLVVMCLCVVIWLVRSEGQRYRDSMREAVREGAREVVRETMREGDKLIETAGDETQEVVREVGKQGRGIIEQASKAPGQVLQDLNDTVPEVGKNLRDAPEKIGNVASQLFDRAIGAPEANRTDDDLEGAVGNAAGKTPSSGGSPDAPVTKGGNSAAGRAATPEATVNGAGPATGQAPVLPPTRPGAANPPASTIPSSTGAGYQPVRPQVPTQPYRGHPAAQPPPSRATPNVDQRAYVDEMRGQMLYSLMAPRKSRKAAAKSAARRIEMTNRVHTAQAYFAAKQVNRQARYGHYPMRRELNLQKRMANRQKQMIRYGQQGKPRRTTIRDLDPVTGKIHWPRVLHSEEYSQHRQRLDQLFQERARYGAFSGVIDEAYGDVKHAATGMKLLLSQHIQELHTSQYLAARQFLDRLSYEAQFSAG